MELFKQTLTAGQTASFPQGRSFLLSRVNSPVTVKVFNSDNRLMGKAEDIEEGLQFDEPEGFLRVEVYSALAQTVEVLIAQETVFKYNRLKGDVSIDNWPASQTVDGTVNLSKPRFPFQDYHTEANRLRYMGRQYYNPAASSYQVVQIANPSVDKVVVIDKIIIDAHANTSIWEAAGINSSTKLSGLFDFNCHNIYRFTPTNTNVYHGEISSLYTSYIFAAQHAYINRSRQWRALDNWMVPPGYSLILQRTTVNVYDYITLSFFEVDKDDI